MDTKLLLDLTGVAFEILLAYLFFRIFLERWQFSKAIIAGIFLADFLLKAGGSYYLPEAWMRTILGVICYFFIACCYKGSFLKKLVMAFFLWLLNVIVEYSVHSLLMLLAGAIYATGEHDLQDYALGLLLSKLTVLFLCSLCYYRQKYKNEYVMQELNYKWYLAFLIYPIVTVIILIQNYYLILEKQQLLYLKNFLFTSVLMILSNLLIFTILNEMHRLEAVRLQSELVEKQLAAQEKCYAEIVKKNSTIKRYVHDTKNLLLVLQSYIQQGKEHEALEHLQFMLKNLNNDVIDCTGNIVLDTVLSAKIKDAQSQNITVIPAIALYGDLKVRIIDLALLLGNALDNAIEATAKVQSGQERKVLLSVKLQENILHISVKNPVEHQVMIQNQSVKTSKADSELHGLGIQNMKAIVNKYHGTFDIRCTEQMFLLNVILENEQCDQ